MVEEVNSEVGRALPEQTNILDRFVEYLKLEKKAVPEEGGEDGGGSEFGDFNDDSFGDEASPAVDGEMDDVEAMASAVAQHLPADASHEEIAEIVEQVSQET